MWAKCKRSVFQTTALVSSALRWSSLATIGNSTLVKLTIFAPFLGYIVLYNEYVVSILTLSPDALGGAAENDALKQTILRINFLYFGLVSLGIASGLFSIFCPKDISKNVYVVDYIQYVTPVSTDSLLRGYFEKLLEIYLGRHAQFPHEERLTHAYPEELFGSTAEIAKQLYMESEGDGDSNDEKELYTASGYFQVPELVHRVLWKAKIYEYYYISVMGGVSKYTKDILYLYHIMLDHSVMPARLVVFVFYIIGFILLSVPTIETSWILMRHWVF